MNKVLLAIVGILVPVSICVHANSDEAQISSAGWECEATGRPPFAVHDTRVPVLGERMATEAQAKASALNDCESAHYSVCRLDGCWDHAE